MAQGIGGFMALTGTADGEPTRAGVPVSDIFTGVYSVIGILAALQRRERTGKGGYVDTALVDSTVGVLANQAMNYLASGDVPKRIGNAHPNIVPYQVFPVADGHIIIATGNDSQYGKLVRRARRAGACEESGLSRQQGSAEEPQATDRSPLGADEKFKRDDLLEKLEAVGVPAGPINDLDQVFEDPQVKHRGMQIHPEDRCREGRLNSRRAHADHARRRADGGGESRHRGWGSTRRRFCGRLGSSSALIPGVAEAVEGWRTVGFAPSSKHRFASSQVGQGETYAFANSRGARARLRIPPAATIARCSA